MSQVHHPHPQHPDLHWFEVEQLPWWWHICRAHCTGYAVDGYFERCVCGGIRRWLPAELRFTPWGEHNSRRSALRKEQRRQRRVRGGGRDA